MYYVASFVLSFFTSLSLLAYCSVACHFCCRVVAFYILSLSCHLPWVVFSEIHCFRLYILDKSKFLKFSVSSHDAITTFLGCSHVLFVLFISSCNTPNLFWSDNWDSFTMFESFNFSVSDFFVCLSYFLCQKTLIFATTCSRWWSEDTSALLFALTSYRDDLWAIAMWSNWFSYLWLVLQRLVNFLQ